MDGAMGSKICFLLSPPIHFLTSGIFSKTRQQLVENKIHYVVFCTSSQENDVFLLNERKACNFTGMNNIALRGFD